MAFIPNYLRGKRREEQGGKGEEEEPLLFFKNYFLVGTEVTGAVRIFVADLMTESLILLIV